MPNQSEPIIATMQFSEETKQALQGVLREAQELLDAREKQMERRNTWVKWGMLLAGLVALVVGVHMGGLIYGMSDNMDRMRQYMENMGDGEKSYMGQMSTNMLAMRESMTNMEQSMETMSTDMGSMKVDMQQMSGDIQTMNVSMEKMQGDIAAVPEMQQDVNQMSRSVGGMSYDTAIMRNGVHNMSRDTSSMSHPFRVMNPFLP